MTTEQAEQTANARHQAAYRERRKTEGLTEVRGIWAKPEDHAKARAAAKKAIKPTTRKLTP